MPTPGKRKKFIKIQPTLERLNQLSMTEWLKSEGLISINKDGTVNFHLCEIYEGTSNNTTIGTEKIKDDVVLYETKCISSMKFREVLLSQLKTITTSTLHLSESHQFTMTLTPSHTELYSKRPKAVPNTVDYGFAKELDEKSRQAPLKLQFAGNLAMLPLHGRALRRGLSALSNNNENGEFTEIIKCVDSIFGVIKSIVDSIDKLPKNEELSSFYDALNSKYLTVVANILKASSKDVEKFISTTHPEKNIEDFRRRLASLALQAKATEICNSSPMMLDNPSVLFTQKFIENMNNGVRSLIK